jgi:hypothetical protein
MTELEYVFAVLRLFAWDDCDALWWHTNEQGGDITFSVNCSDTFALACADSERIEASDLPDLERAKKDLPEGDWSLLWVSRKRGCRPMEPYLKRMDSLERALMEAAGPPHPASFF